MTQWLARDIQDSQMSADVKGIYKFSVLLWHGHYYTRVQHTYIVWRLQIVNSWTHEYYGIQLYESAEEVGCRTEEEYAAEGNASTNVFQWSRYT